MVKKKELPADYLKALEKARTSVRKSATDVEYVDSEIQAIFEIGEHPTSKHPIQAGEFIVDGKVRNMIFVEADTIKAIFGEVKENGTLANIDYDGEGVPSKVKVPDIAPNNDNQYWFTLPKK